MSRDTPHGEALEALQEARDVARSLEEDGYKTMAGTLLNALTLAEMALTSTNKAEEFVAMVKGLDVAQNNLEQAAARYRYLREFPSIVIYRPEDRVQGTYALSKTDQLDADVDAAIAKGHA